MKIAGLTWWRGNYGSILQAYALQQVLNGINGVEYEIIDQYGEMVSANNLFYKLKHIGVKKTLTKIRWKFASAGFHARNKALQNFIAQNLILSSVQYTAETIQKAVRVYDGFVCGSDQVWNPTLSDFDDIYWLTFAEKDKLKIAYAPSVGVTEVSPDQAEQIRRNLASFTAISCREESGTELLNSIIGNNTCKTVLDPTLLLPREKWDRICPATRFNKKYVFAYILRGNKEQRQLIEKYAQKHNLKIVTFPYLDVDYIEKYDKEFGDEKVYDASPSDFISLIRNAECVFTDSFHCSIFSILYHKNFYVLPKKGKSQQTRLSDLQAKFEINARMITQENTIDQIDTVEEVNWQRVDQILCLLRAESQEYLENALRKE